MTETRRLFQGIAEEWPEILSFHVTSPELAKEIERRWNNHQSLLDALKELLLFEKLDDGHVDLANARFHAQVAIRKAEQ